MSTNNGINRLRGVFQEKTLEEEVEFETSMLAMAFLSDIEKEVELKGIKRKELAEMVGTSASYITQIFRGNKTPNLKILTALGLAVGKKFHVQLVDDIQDFKNQEKAANQNYNVL